MDGAFKMAEMSLNSTEISSKPSTIETRICRINILKTAINEIEQKNSSADKSIDVGQDTECGLFEDVSISIDLRVQKQCILTLNSHRRQHAARAPPPRLRRPD